MANDGFIFDVDRLAWHFFCVECTRGGSIDEPEANLALLRLGLYAVVGAVHVGRRVAEVVAVFFEYLDCHVLLVLVGEFPRMHCCQADTRVPRLPLQRVALHLLLFGSKRGLAVGWACNVVLASRVRLELIRSESVALLHDGHWRIVHVESSVGRAHCQGIDSVLCRRHLSISPLRQMYQKIPPFFVAKYSRMNSRTTHTRT